MPGLYFTKKFHKTIIQREKRHQGFNFQISFFMTKCFIESRAESFCMSVFFQINFAYFYIQIQLLFFGSCKSIHSIDGLFSSSFWSLFTTHLHVIMQPLYRDLFLTEKMEGSDPGTSKRWHKRERENLLENTVWKAKMWKNVCSLGVSIKPKYCTVS